MGSKTVLIVGAEEQPERVRQSINKYVQSAPIRSWVMVPAVLLPR